MVKLSHIGLHVIKTVSTGEEQQEIRYTEKKRCIERKVGDRRQMQRLSLASSHPPTSFRVKF